MDGLNSGWREDRNEEVGIRLSLSPSCFTFQFPFSPNLSSENNHQVKDVERKTSVSEEESCVTVIFFVNRSQTCCCIM